jgi:tetratricopeptide (TPR) repeat protein
MWITRRTALVSTNRTHISWFGIALVLVTILALNGVVSATPQPLQDLANEADTAYKDGKYDQAVTLYSNIISSGYSSGQLFYNLGNSYFKSGRLGPSILMYERAVRLMPHNDDVRHNLEFARERTVDRIDPPPRLFIWTWVDALRDWLPPSTIAISALVLSLLLALTIALVVNMRGNPLWPSVQAAAWVLAVLFTVNMALVGLRVQADKADSSAIIMADKIDVRSAPDRTSNEIFALHEGTKVAVVQSLDAWVEIRLADGRQGWVPISSFEII